MPGDEVLADRGFNVEDAFRFYCAKIATPPFTRGKKQLSKLEVDTARQLSRVRIHVERVIGLLRQKYTTVGRYFSVAYNFAKFANLRPNPEN